MKKFYFCYMLLLTGAFLFFLLGIINNELEVGFFLIFPIIIGSGIFSFLGFVLLFSSIVLFIYKFVLSIDKSTDLYYDRDYKKPKKTIKTGGIVLIGPIPILFGSNWKITLLMIIISFIILLIFLNFIYFHIF